MTTGERVAAAGRRAAAYLLGRQCPQGGFCFYRNDDLNEPNLSDTYHALAALAQLGIEWPQRERVHDFLRAFSPHDRQPSDLFHLTGIARLLDPGYVPDDGTRTRIDALRVPPAPHRCSTRLTSWLARTRLIVRLQREFGSAPRLPATAARVAGLLHDGGFGAGPNLVDTELAIDILQVCRVRAALPGLREFVDRLQVGGCGFTNTTDSWSARLHIVAAGVRCCCALELPVRFRREAIDFILACQSAGGGFADAPEALPDIVLTHEAVDALRALSAPRQLHD